MHSMRIDSIWPQVWPWGRKGVLALVMGGFGLLLQTAPVSAVTPPDSCFEFDALTNTITKYYDYQGDTNANPACPKDVDIPSAIATVAVNTIGSAAFNNKGLTSVTIPNSVTNIGTQAFDSNQLTTLTLPSSLTSTGDGAFSYNQLTSLTLPASITTISNDSFSYNQLTSVTLPSSVNSIMENAFSHNLLVSITVPNGVTEIKGGSFDSNKLTSIHLPPTVTAIRQGAFNNNQLTSITIPSSVTTIEDIAFANNKIHAIALPGVTSLHSWAFIRQSPFGGDIDAELYSGDQARTDAARDSIWYTRVSTVDSSNPHNLSNGVYVESEQIGQDYGCPIAVPCPHDINGDGDMLDTFNYGGHLINAAPLTVEYVSDSGHVLAPSSTWAGHLVNGEYIYDYLVKNGPSVPGDIDTMEPSPADIAKINQSLTPYFRVGQTVTLDPVTINGYTIPARQAKVLGDSTTVTFVYTQTVPTSTTTLAKTGMDAQTLALSGLVLLGIGVVGYRRYAQRHSISSL